MRGPLVEVLDLWKSFGKISAVRGVSLKLENGQVHGLLGPNGSGKTTTLKCIVGLLKPDKGNVRIFGEEISSSDGFKRLVGYLPENPSLPDYLTVKEFLVFYARLKGLEAEQVTLSVSEFIDAFDLSQFSDRLLYELSKGVRQRVAVAASLTGSPTVLILDEPFNGLDPEAQKTTKTYINQVLKDGGAVLVSTHLLDSAEKLCNHASILFGGEVLYSAPLHRIKESHPGKSLEEIFMEIVSKRREAKLAT